jgi:hypothetical protein
MLSLAAALSQPHLDLGENICFAQHPAVQAFQQLQHVITVEHTIFSHPQCIYILPLALARTCVLADGS